MRHLRIPQQPDRPDIDDLIFGEEHETNSGKKKNAYRYVHAGYARWETMRPRGFFIFISRKQEKGSSILNMKNSLEQK